MTTTIVTIATIPIAGEDPKLNWQWKFYLVNGNLLRFAGSGDSDNEDGYEEGFIDGVLAANMSAGISQVIIDDFGMEQAMEPTTSVSEQDRIIREGLAKMIPLGKILEN